MDFKKLEKLARIYDKVKLLDSEIIEIEKFAMVIADGDVEISFGLSVLDLAKQQEEEAKRKVDPYGSIAGGENWIHSYIGIVAGRVTYNEDKPNTKQYKSELHENTALKILGLLLYEKQHLREKLLKQIQEL